MKRLLALLALTFGTGALAQTYALEARDPSWGIPLPPTGAALLDDATSPNLNPAGLAFVDRFQLAYLHDRNVGLGEVAPLPAWGTESLDMARHALAALSTTPDGPRLRCGVLASGE